MSNFGNFNLSSLSSMSTLGSLAQSAQRLDRLMAGNRSRQQDTGNNARRLMDNDFFGARNHERNRGRSPSPQRRVNRGDRRNANRRDRVNARRKRDDNFYGPASGAGILGAAPNRNGRSSGTGDDSTWNESSGNQPQFNQQAQQLLNMMQTQQLLAAVQAQAKLANQQQPPSLMSSTVYPRQIGGRMSNPRGGRFNRNDRSRQGISNRREDRKRKHSPPSRPFRRDRRGDNESKYQPIRKLSNDVSAKKNATKEKDDVEASAKKQEEPSKISRNAAGEDIEELIRTNFDGKRYWCTLCKIVCVKLKNIRKHFLSERHVKAVFERDGKVFDPEIMKQQEIKEEKPKPKDIREVLKYVCSTKQTARKENKDIYISSLTDCTVKVTDFSCEEGFMGSEFVKAVSGFKCQLCNVFMRQGNDIIQHLKGKKHQYNYQAYLKENPDYLDKQREVNKRLLDMLMKDEGQEVVLQDCTGDKFADINIPEEKPDDVDFEVAGRDSVDVLKTYDDSKMENEAEKGAALNESDLDNGAVDETEDMKTVDSNVEKEDNEEKSHVVKNVDEKELEVEMKEHDDKIVPEEKMEDEMTKEEANSEEKKDVMVEVGVEDHDVIVEAGVEEDDVNLEAGVEDDEFPLEDLLPKHKRRKSDHYNKSDTKSSELNVKESDIVVKTPDMDSKTLENEEQETPETPMSNDLAEEETEDVTPKRGKKGKRGRGSTKATRGRRRTTPRTVKTSKNSVENIEMVERVSESPKMISKKQKVNGTKSSRQAVQDTSPVNISEAEEKAELVVTGETTVECVAEKFEDSEPVNKQEDNKIGDDSKEEKNLEQLESMKKPEAVEDRKTENKTEILKESKKREVAKEKKRLRKPKSGKFAEPENEVSNKPEVDIEKKIEKDPEVKKQDSKVQKENDVEKESGVKKSDVIKEPEFKMEPEVKKEPEVKIEPEAKNESEVKKDPEVKKESKCKEELKEEELMDTGNEINAVEKTEVDVKQELENDSDVAKDVDNYEILETGSELSDDFLPLQDFVAISKDEDDDVDAFEVIDEVESDSCESDNDI